MDGEISSGKCLDTPVLRAFKSVREGNTDEAGQYCILEGCVIK